MSVVATSVESEEEFPIDRDTVITLHWARLSLDEHSFSKGVFPLKVGIMKTIREFADWLDYPAGEHRFGNHPRRIQGVAISEDGRHCYSGSKDGTMIHWDLLLHAIVLKWDAHNYGLMDVDCHSGLVVSGASDYRISLWDGHTHKLKWSKRTEKVLCVTFHKSGETVLGGTDIGCVVEFQVRTGVSLGRYDYHRGVVTSVISDPVKTTYWLSSAKDLAVRLWFAGGARTKQKDQPENLCDLSMNCDRTLIASCGDSTINLRTYTKLQLIRSIDISVYVICFHPKNPHILAAGSSNKLVLFNVENGELMHTFVDSGYVSSRPMRFTPDGTRLLVGNGSVLMMYDLKGII